MTTGATAVALGDHLPRYNKKEKKSQNRAN